MVVSPDRLLLSGSSSVRVMPGAKRTPSPSWHRQYIDQDLVDESPLEALGRNVGAQDLQVLAARGVQRRGDHHRCHR